MAIYKKLETRPAPLGTRGVIYWVRENLFPSITSSILTVLSFLLLYFTVYYFLFIPHVFSYTIPKYF